MITTLPQFVTQLRWPRGKWLDCGCQGHQFESCLSCKIDIVPRQMEYYQEWLFKNAIIFRVTQISTVRWREHKDGRTFGEHMVSYGKLPNCHCWIMASWCWLVGKIIFTSTLVEQTNIHIDSGWIFGEFVVSYEKLMSCHGGTMASWRQLVEQINIHIDSGLSKITAPWSSSSGN